MNNRIVVIISAILAVSLIVNGYLYVTNTQTQNQLHTQYNELQYTIGYAGNTELERDALKEQVDDLILQRDTARSDVEWLNGRINTLDFEITELTNTVNYLTNSIDDLIDERNALKTFIVLISGERDTARADVDVLLGKVNQQNIDIASLTNERDTLKEELVDIADEVGDLRWKLRFSIDRIKQINDGINDNGSQLSWTGYLINAGVTEVSGIEFHIEAWDLLEQKVINVTAGANGNLDATWTLSSGRILRYTCRLDYSPYALSRYNITLIWEASEQLQMG